jgi:hypothetical protein
MSAACHLKREVLKVKEFAINILKCEQSGILTYIQNTKSLKSNCAYCHMLKNQKMT